MTSDRAEERALAEREAARLNPLFGTRPEKSCANRDEIRWDVSKEGSTLNRSFVTLRRLLIVGGVCALVVAIGSIAWATTSANGRIVACAKKSGGALRIVSKAANCKNDERAVVWNVRGEEGYEAHAALSARVA